MPKRAAHAWKSTSESHSCCSHGCPLRVNDQWSIMGKDRCSSIHRPVARCHHRSEPRIGVYPNDQKEGMTARYHKAEIGQEVVRGDSVMPRFLGAAIGGKTLAPHE